MRMTMARKESVTKNMILETAVQLAKEEGIENVTARKLANKIGCSTQPIFRVYANMTELYTEVYQKAIDLFADYYVLLNILSTNLSTFIYQKDTYFRLLITKKKQETAFHVLILYLSPFATSILYRQHKFIFFFIFFFVFLKKWLLLRIVRFYYIKTI